MINSCIIEVKRIRLTDAKQLNRVSVGGGLEVRRIEIEIRVGNAY